MDDDYTTIDQNLDDFEDKIQNKSKLQAKISIYKYILKNKFDYKKSKDQRRYINAGLKLMLKSLDY